MFGKTRDYDLGGAGTRDERLRALMSQWRAVDPSTDFEAAVWRRIRAVPAAQPSGLWDRRLGWFLTHPVWAGAAAASVAMAIGLLAGLATPGHARAGGHETHALLQPGTLMGAYAALSERGHP